MNLYLKKCEVTARIYKLFENAASTFPQEDAQKRPGNNIVQTRVSNMPERWNHQS